MQVTVRVDNDLAVLDLEGRFDSYTAPDVTKTLQRTQGKTQRVMVNLEGVEFVDSTALAVLVQAMKRSRQRGGELYLCGMRPPVHMIFELARLDQAFTIFANEHHARQTFTTMEIHP
ncbi:MAG: STAS domain-containing protein [Oscillochloris sp.]|nr:STAS domain-containing protein [Oscillochloris sp.]